MHQPGRGQLVIAGELVLEQAGRLQRVVQL